MQIWSSADTKRSRDRLKQRQRGAETEKKSRERLKQRQRIAETE